MVLSYQMMGSSLWVKLSLGRPKPHHIFCFVADVRGCIHFLLATVRREFEKRGQNLPELEALLFTSLGAHACGSFFV